MKTNQAVPFDEVLAKLRHNEEFRKAERQFKPYYEVVKAIFKRRIELGLTQKDLAEKANTHQSRISKIESAEHDIRLSTLIQIAEALKTEVSFQLIPFEYIPFIDNRGLNYFYIQDIRINSKLSEDLIDTYSDNPSAENIYDQKYSIPI